MRYMTLVDESASKLQITPDSLNWQTSILQQNSLKRWKRGGMSEIDTKHTLMQGCMNKKKIFVVKNVFYFLNECGTS
jgi:hypothetical protein